MGFSGSCTIDCSWMGIVLTTSGCITCIAPWFRTLNVIGQPGDRGPRASGSNGMSMRNFQPINRHAGSLLSSAMGERFSRRHSARFV
jgi:hypothetical protein